MDDITKKRTSQPCPACGGTTYAWGILYANGIIFQPGNPTMLVTNGARLLTRLCNDCGNLQVFNELVTHSSKLPG
jgi:ribosomal protein S27AE